MRRWLRFWLSAPVDLTGYLDPCAVPCGEEPWPLESGPDARRCDVAWLRTLRDQCGAAGVPYFLKQAVHSPITYGTGNIRLTSLEDVTVGPGSKRKPAGVIELPYLDGVQHAAFPRSP